MNLELDHLFICTYVGAPEADELLKFGLIEGQGSFHLGQGTACRRFFFHNSFLEVLWVRDKQEAQSEPVGPLGLWDRWQYPKTGSSPFGVALRPTQPTTGRVKLPFQTWTYLPPLSSPLQVEVAENSACRAEPLLTYLSFGKRPDAYPEGMRQPLEHVTGFKEITGLRFTVRSEGARSGVLEAVEQTGLATFVPGESHLAEVIFDREKRGMSKDFRPRLPLVFRW